VQVDYDFSVFPPAPTVDVWLGVPGDALSVGPLRGLLDTGADISIVPVHVTEQIGVQAANLRYLRRYGDVRRQVRVYLLDVGIGRARLPGIEVVADDADDEIIIGRDVLNRLTILLDGPHRVTKIGEA